MFKNYLLLAFRNLKKQKGYTSINLLGMTVGMACCFLMFAYVFHERNYDTFFPKGEQLYRLVYEVRFSDEPVYISRIPAPLAPYLPEKCAGIESAARFYPRSVSVKELESEQQFEIEHVFFADSTALEVLGLEMLRGNPATALKKPFSLVLTESTAKRIFGDRDPMGKGVSFSNQNTFTVTGILRDLPNQSHIHFSMLAPYQNIPDAEREGGRDIIRHVMDNNWTATYNYAYVRLRQNADETTVNAEIDAVLKTYGDERRRDKQTILLEKVRDVHLGSRAGGTETATANLTYLRLFALIGILTLLIACINFINLSTAIYLGRMKEIGVRKVLGAGRQSLIAQFMGETFLVGFAAFSLALALFWALLPHFNALMNINMSLSILANGQLAGLFISTFFISVLLAGLYPAFFASRFKAVDIFQDRMVGGKTGGSGWLRKGLITVQFAVGTALTIGTLVIFEQLQFWEKMPLGFNSNQIITVPLTSPGLNSALFAGDGSLRPRMNAFEEKLMLNPDIKASTLASRMPGQRAVKHPVWTDEMTQENNAIMQVFSVDYDYAETFQLELLAGRDFDKSYGTDHLEGIMINEAALHTFGWASPDEALGKAVHLSYKDCYVVGVIGDFNTQTLRDAIEPFVLEVSPGMFTTFAIQLNTRNLPNTISQIEKLWAEFFPEKAFEYAFHDEELAAAYSNEQTLAKLIGNFSGVAIFLACFGLFGIISFTVQQRSKEIGIRKILGASVGGIVRLLSFDFLKLVLLAILIASPIAYSFMERWLTDFAYRIDMPIWVFVVAAVFAVGLAFLTISVQSVRAALVHPVESLKDE